MVVDMGGAALFVHLTHGVFVENGGWELVGVIGAGVIALAAGPYCRQHRPPDHQAAGRAQRENGAGLVRGSPSRPPGRTSPTFDLSR